MGEQCGMVRSSKRPPPPFTINSPREPPAAVADITQATSGLSNSPTRLPSRSAGLPAGEAHRRGFHNLGNISTAYTQRTGRSTPSRQ